MKGNKTNVLEQANSDLRKQMKKNRYNIQIKTNNFKHSIYATHDFSLRGKISTLSIFHDLINFRTESVK